MAKEEEKTVTARDSVQLSVTEKGLEVQQNSGEPTVAQTAADVPWWVKLHLQAYARQAREAESAEDNKA